MTLWYFALGCITLLLLCANSTLLSFWLSFALFFLLLSWLTSFLVLDCRCYCWEVSILILNVWWHHQLLMRFNVWIPLIRYRWVFSRWLRLLSFLWVTLYLVDGVVTSSLHWAHFPWLNLVLSAKCILHLHCLVASTPLSAFCDSEALLCPLILFSSAGCITFISKWWFSMDFISHCLLWFP